MGLFNRKKTGSRPVGAAYDETMWRFPSQFIQPGEKPIGQMVVRHSNAEYMESLDEADRRAHALLDQMEVFPGSGTIGATRGLGTIWFTDRQVIIGKPQHRADLDDQIFPYTQINALVVDAASSTLTISGGQGTITVTCPTKQSMEAANMLLSCWQATR